MINLMVNNRQTMKSVSSSGSFLSNSQQCCWQCDVLVKKWEDFIQNGVSIPLLTETDLTVTLEEEIKIRITASLHCARAKLGQSSKTTLTVKNSGQPFSVHIPEGETMINLTRGHLIKRGKNLLVLQSDSTYTLNSDTPSLYLLCHSRIDNTRVFSTSITRYIHLYVIDSPVIHRGWDNTTLVCHLNNTGSCNNLVVSFIKEENNPQNITKNVTVGHCFRGSIQTHQRLRFYFNESSTDGIDCIMEFSSSLSPQDTGRYHCVVQILNAESKELVINGSGYELIQVSESTVAPPINDKSYLLPVIIGSATVVGVLLIISIVIAVIGTIYCRKRAAARPANRNGYEDLSENSVNPPSPTTSLTFSDAEDGQNTDNPNVVNGPGFGLERHPIDEPPSTCSMLSHPNCMPAGDRHLQLSADAAKQLNPSTFSTASTLWKPKLQGAQAAARHNTTRRTGRKKARSRQHKRESSEVYPLSSDTSNVPTTSSLSSSEDEGDQNANDPNAGNGMASSSGLEGHSIDEPPSSMSSQPNSMPAGNQQLPAGAAKPLNPSTPSSTLLSMTKPKLQGAQAAASHSIRRVEREKAHSRQHRRESRKGLENGALISKDTTTRT